jgi:hypothetical protein
MVRENDRWNGALGSLQLLQEAFWYESDVFRLELVKAWRAVTDYISRAALRSVHAQLARVLFIVGRSGLLLGIGEALQDEYAPVEGQLPDRLAVLLKQLEEGSLEGASTRHPSMRAA